MPELEINTLDASSDDGTARASLLGVLLLAFGLVLIAFGIFQGWQQIEARTWVAAQGVVVESRVLEQDGGGSVGYTPIVRYRYSVNQQLRENNAITLRDRACPISGLCLPLRLRASDRDAAQATVERYPVNEAATIYFNPGNPDQSVLERRVHPLVYVLVIGGLLAMLGGLLRLVLG